MDCRGTTKKNDKIYIDQFKNKIIKAYIIGNYTDFFVKQIVNKIDYEITKNLNQSIIQIFNSFPKRKKLTVLFSPASASYDQFKNFVERGEKFKNLVKFYAKNLINSERVSDYWRNINKDILFCFLALFFLGIFFSFSSTSSLAGERLNKDFYHYFSKHLIFSIIAILLMFFISYLKTSFLKKIILPIFAISLVMLIMVPFIGIEIKGSKRWLDLFFFRLQPVEIIKPFFVLITASLICRGKEKTSNYSYFLSLIILSIILILLLNQPDIGQSILLITTWISIIFISGIKISYIFIFFVLVTLSSILLLIIFPEKFGYISQRLITFFDPSQGDNFQTDKALAAIKQGGLKGQGMGEGILKDSVPEAHTDYIIAVITEEFGSIISIFVIIIFLYISYKIIKKMYQNI